jgi:ABC-type multidrug transport system fused ATPase/permease subunit
VIFVVNGGEIVERGSHTDLLRHRGLYADLCAPQLRLAA